ncbi:hypothetical protein CRUP_006738 [Coryphaenoides rupestris]|nr:hypothetical protein CRUP_006738 [Coryphaenoides rupestris]
MGSQCRSGKYRVERDVLDQQRLEEISQRKTYSDTHPKLTERLKYSLRCTVPKLKQCIVGSLPVLYWLPRYSIWDYGMPDLISGISVGIMHLPQGMAYALLASLPPVFGLYTSLYPALVYFVFGTSRHISIGTFAVLSIMVGGVTERLAPDSDFLTVNGTNLTGGQVDVHARDFYRVQVAAATTVLGGLIQVVLGLVKFGFVGTYLSEPLVRAYTTAASAHAVVAQLKYIFGVSPKRFSGSLSLVYTHLPTLVVSAVSMTFLIAVKELNSYLSPKLPVPIPVELIMVSGHLSPPSLPKVNVFGEVIGDAFALAIVGYAISISLGKTFALKHGYKVDSNQELVALGLSNAVGGFFQCYSVCSSMSRSLIQESTGGKTQAVLAAIVFVNLKGMFKQYSDIPQLWRSNKIDLMVWLVTWVSTLLFNLDLGLAASIVFALLTVIFRTQLRQGRGDELAVIHSHSALCSTYIGLFGCDLVPGQRIAARGGSRRGIPLAWTEDHPSTTVTLMKVFIIAFRDDGSAAAGSGGGGGGGMVMPLVDASSLTITPKAWENRNGLVLATDGMMEEELDGEDPAEVLAETVQGGLRLVRVEASVILTASEK